MARPPSLRRVVATRSRAASVAIAFALLPIAISAPPAAAQVFLASRPNTEVTVGPLFVRATVTPALDPTTVDVFFSLVVPPQRSAADLEEGIYLLWPGAVVGAGKGQPDPALGRFIAERHFNVIADGTLSLQALNLYRLDGELPPEPIKGGAPFVTYVRQGGALGLTAPATYIHIPWTPKLVNRAWLMDLRFSVTGLVRRKQATWVEEMFWGRRQFASFGFHDLRSRSIFPLYFEQRDRVLHLAEDPSQLLLNFTNSDRLKIDSVSPSTATRRTSESAQSTEVVSLFLDRSVGLAPQVMAVQFGYFSGLQAWTPILIPMLFFMLGNLAGPLLRMLAQRVGKTLAARVHVGRAEDAEAGTSTGVVLGRDTLTRLAPGETTYDEVLRLCGPDVEEHEQLDRPGYRTLVYRGRRVVPHRGRTFGWLSTVRSWDVEHHEVEIALAHDRVSDVRAHVRRSRPASPDDA
jgi:hypothetical protein